MAKAKAAKVKENAVVVDPPVEPVAPVAEAPPVVTIPARIPHPDEDVVLMPKYVPTYSPYGPEGLYVADHRLDKDLFIMIRGERYEHCSEAPDGRWVYRKS